jgi:hypothetical protein
MPIGALFTADPITGKYSTNPENVGENPNFATMTETATGNSLADWHPYGEVYGTNSTYMLQNIAWANYNGLQVSWIKTTGRLTFDLNGTWSKMLGTTLQENPYLEGQNYGPTAEDRPLVFNTSYTYNSGTLHYGSSVVNQLLSGWTISGISTWQAGGYIPAALGDGVPNFSMGLQYTNLPSDTTGASCGKPGGCNLSADTGVSDGLSSKSYFGTDENIPIMPVLTCNPTSGLASHQVLNGKCFDAPALAFNAPAVAAGTGSLTGSAQGGQNFPYMKATPYFDNDLALYRTFHIHENQNVQLRFSAFDWLNHSLLEFASGSYYSINYNVNYATQAISPNYNQGSTGSTPFGVMTVRSQLPYARVIELDAKYSF